MEQSPKQLSSKLGVPVTMQGPELLGGNPLAQSEISRDHEFQGPFPQEQFFPKGKKETCFFMCVAQRIVCVREREENRKPYIGGLATTVPPTSQEVSIVLEEGWSQA